MVAILIIPQHFEKYRAIAFGSVSASSGLGTMMFPWLIKHLTEQYGWRGGVVLISGLFLNTCVLSMFFHNNKMPKHDNNTNVIEELNNHRTEVPAEENVITKSLDTIKTYIKGLKNATFCAFYVGCLLQFCGLGIVYTHIVAYTESVGFSTDWSSFIVTLIAALTLGEYRDTDYCEATKIL